MTGVAHLGAPLPCPTCGELVDKLLEVEPGVLRRDGIRLAHPCAHLVAIVNVLPGGGLELGRPDPPVVVGPGSADQVATELAQLAGDLEAGAATVDDEHPLAGVLRGVAGGVMEAFVLAMTDAGVLGTGWVRFTSVAGGPPVPERVDPARVIVVDP